MLVYSIKQFTIQYARYEHKSNVLCAFTKQQILSPHLQNFLLTVTLIY